MPISRRLLICASLGALASHVAAQPDKAVSTRDKFFVPYSPSSAAEAAVDLASSWAEVYQVSPGSLRSELASILGGKVPELPVLVMAGGKAYATIAGKPVELVEEFTEVLRGRKSVEYLEDCSVTPRVGDRLETRYRLAEYELRASLALVHAVSLGYLSVLQKEPVKLDLRKPEHCKAESESRLFYSGQVTLFKAGQEHQKLTVLVQSITQR